ncbi:hypothetical protein [Rhizobium binxianense]|uniref:hypothetical protein n=1 Tax=Rhizobium binxianense TaxID=3024242 RepID=UPI0023602360|nr:hypothetical protein [Rhizobium sp. MJ37]MDC9832544.1 hypothetical protein [Rhizobium sp. MJ37]
MTLIILNVKMTVIILIVNDATAETIGQPLQAAGEAAPLRKIGVSMASIESSAGTSPPP